MIDHRKRIKLGDFGLARRVSHDEGSVIRGTAKYMSPETLSQEFGEVGPQSDLYSLGFTAYELMCGARFESLFPGLDAFGRDRQAAWMMWHAASDRTLPDVSKAMTNVPAPLARVINRLVEKNPKQRYRSAEEALADLGAAAAEPASLSGHSTSLSPKTKEPANSKRWLVVGAFVVSMGLSALMLLWSPDSPTTSSPQGEPVVGILRSVDADGRSLEYEDPATGQPAELSLPENPRIRLIADGGADEFILPKRLQPGDWIRLEPASDRWQLDVARPVVNEGRMESVDVPGRRINVLIDQQRVRASATLHVPARAKIELNGQTAGLRDLAADDRISVEHVLDPAGKQGRVVSRLTALRDRELTGTITDVDPSGKALSLQTPAQRSVESLAVAPDVQLSFGDGAPASWSDVAPGQRVKIIADAAVRRMTLFHDAATAGLLKSVDVAGNSLTIEGADRQPMQIAIAANADIRINGARADLQDLRPQIDQVQLATRKSTTGADEAAVIDAIRAARHDRCVILVANGGSRDGSLPPSAHAAEDGRLIHNAAVSYYATPAEMAVLLIDRTREEVRSELEKRLSSLRPGTQAIVLFEGSALIESGQPLLACADFELSKAAATGLPLADVLAMVEKSPSQQKMLVLDVTHRAPGFNDPRFAPPDEILKALTATPAITTVICSVAAETDPQRRTSAFAEALAKALQGRADSDRNLTITADELTTFLKSDDGGGPGPIQWPSR
jgi:hypothetical protein